MRNLVARTTWWLCITTSLLWVPIVAAQSANDSSWRIELDNDSWEGEQDSNYTHGTRITRRTSSAPAWLQGLARPLGCHACTRATGAEFEVGQEIYTPYHIYWRGQASWDRPYAGWLYAKASLLAEEVSARPGRSHFSAISLQVGVVGPASLAEQTQKLGHDMLGKDTPLGWDYQLDNEPGVVLRYQRGMRFGFAGRSDGTMTHRVSPYVVAAVGNVATHAGVGAEYRARLGKGSMANGWQILLGYEARAVVRNVFLDGNTWSPSHSVEKEPVVMEGSVGLQYQGQGFGLRLSRQYRSQEFVGQPWPDEFSTLSFWLGQRIED